MGEKLTKVQLRLLKRFAAMPSGSSMSLESENRGYFDMPIFRAWLRPAACPTCGATGKGERVSFDCVVALHSRGAIAERVRGSEVFYNDDITPAGRAALEASDE